MIFIEGIIVGLSFALMMGFGPSFFTLIQTSINRGFKSAMFLDIGIILNDIMVVALMMMTNLQFNINDEKSLLYPGIAASIILIIFGIYTFTLSPNKIIHISENNNHKIDKMNDKFDDDAKWYFYISKGFVINIFNPFVWIFWMNQEKKPSRDCVFFQKDYLIRTRLLTRTMHLPPVIIKKEHSKAEWNNISLYIPDIR